jgi:hypothetical protein
MNGWSLLATMVATLLSGGLAGVLFKFKLDRARLTKEERHEVREEQREDFKLILDVVTVQRNEAFDEVKELRRQVEVMSREVQGLRLSREIDPFPSWIVDLDGHYLLVNREFERAFLEPRGLNYRDVIGETHDKVWPEDFVAKLAVLDKKARSTPDKRARAVVVVDGRKLTIHKFPICVRGIPVAFAGYVTEIE